MLAAAGCYHAPETARGDADAGPDAPMADAGPTNLAWSWTFGGAAACPTGVDRVQIETAQWDVSGINFRQEPAAPVTFPCSAGTGGVLVPDGFDYDSWLTVLTADGRVFDVTGPGHVDLGTTATHDVVLPRGYVHIAWSLFGQTSQTTLACSDVPSLTAGGLGRVQLFTGTAVQTTPMATTGCSAGELWYALPAGTYDLALRAVYSRSYLPANGPDAYLLGETTFAAQTIVAGQTLELGTQQLPLTHY
jgi:hypothetical protein